MQCVDLVNLSNLKYDAQGNPIGGSIQLRVNKDSLGTEFAKHFGQDAIISIDYSNNGSANVTSNNGSTGQYNPKTGIISWTSIQPGTAIVAGPTQQSTTCLLYTSPSPRDVEESRMPSSA